MNKGWFKVYRGWMDSPCFRNNDDRIAFLWMLEAAAIKDITISINNSPTVIRRGQFSHSTRFMSEALRLSQTKVRRLLKHFEKWRLIDIDSDTGQNVINICNYSIYQAGLQECGSETGASNDNRAPQDRLGGGSNNKNDKNDKNDKDLSNTPPSPSAQSKNAYSDNFETWWKEYPKKQSKGGAYKKYAKAIKDGASHEELLEGVKRYNDHIKANSIQALYIKHPTTWLNNECWHDELNTGSVAGEADILTDEFLEFWEAFPKKIAKDRVAAKYAQVLASGVPHSELLFAAKWYSRYTTDEGTETPFIKSPLSWLQDNGWEEDLEPNVHPSKRLTPRGARAFP